MIEGNGLLSWGVLEKKIITATPRNALQIAHDENCTKHNHALKKTKDRDSLGRLWREYLILNLWKEDFYRN